MRAGVNRQRRVLLASSGSPPAREQGASAFLVGQLARDPGVRLGDQRVEVGARVPDPGGAVIGRGRDPPAVGRPGDTADHVGVAVEDGQLGTGCGIPHRAVRSLDAVAIRWPSADQASASTQSSWPRVAANSVPSLANPGTTVVDVRTYRLTINEVGRGEPREHRTAGSWRLPGRGRRPQPHDRPAHGGPRRRLPHPGRGGRAARHRPGRPHPRRAGPAGRRPAARVAGRAGTRPAAGRVVRAPAPRPTAGGRLAGAARGGRRRRPGRACRGHPRLLLSVAAALDLLRVRAPGRPPAGPAPPGPGRARPVETTLRYLIGPVDRLPDATVAALGARTRRTASHWHPHSYDAWIYPGLGRRRIPERSEEHTSELQSRPHLVCRLLLEKKKKKKKDTNKKKKKNKTKRTIKK